MVTLILSVTSKGLAQALKVWFKAMSSIFTYGTRIGTEGFRQGDSLQN